MMRRGAAERRAAVAWQRELAGGKIDGAPATHAVRGEGNAGKEVLEELLGIRRGEMGDGLGGHDPEADAAGGHTPQHY